jgi:hypothetical protein
MLKLKYLFAKYFKKELPDWAQEIYNKTYIEIINLSEDNYNKKVWELLDMFMKNNKENLPKKSTPTSIR